MQLFKIDLELGFKENSVFKNKISVFMETTKLYCYRYYKNLEIRDVQRDPTKGIYCFQIYFAVREFTMDAVIELLYSILSESPKFVRMDVIKLKHSIELIADKETKTRILENIKRIESGDNKQKLMQEIYRNFQGLSKKYFSV